MAYDAWGTWNQYITCTQQPIYTSTGSTTLQVYPAMVAVPTPEPEPVDDSALAWLRGQVSEVTELARAA